MSLNYINEIQATERPRTKSRSDGSVLAIIAPKFNAASETFIRNHVRTIAPGNTILVCQNAQGVEQFKCPNLSDIGGDWRSDSNFSRRLLKALRSLYVGPGLLTTDRLRVVSFFELHKPKVVLAEYGSTGCYHMGCCSDANVPLYVHFHGYDGSGLLRNRRWVRYYNRLFQQAAGVIAPSRFIACKLANVGCPEAKLHVVPYGVDPLRFATTKRLPQRFLAVGRLVEKKAPQVTIAAFGQIAGRYPNARLDIIGDGPLAINCRSLIEKLGIGDRVHMHGARDADFVAQLMREASIFVQHSVTAGNGDCEGLPVAILEAMASALPVISTQHSGIPEAVENRETGVLVAEYDVESMASAMADALNHPDHAAAMGEAGRSRVLKHFTIKHSQTRLRSIMGLPQLSSSEATNV
jgi:colanic acid/amylovoran biosynthesis glycosyltransferase